MIAKQIKVGNDPDFITYHFMNWVKRHKVGFVCIQATPIIVIQSIEDVRDIPTLKVSTTSSVTNVWTLNSSLMEIKHNCWLKISERSTMKIAPITVWIIQPRLTSPKSTGTLVSLRPSYVTVLLKLRTSSIKQRENISLRLVHNMGGKPTGMPTIILKFVAISD